MNIIIFVDEFTIFSYIVEHILIGEVMVLFKPFALFIGAADDALALFIK